MALAREHTKAMPSLLGMLWVHFNNKNALLCTVLCHHQQG